MPPIDLNHNQKERLAGLHRRIAHFAAQMEQGKSKSARTLAARLWREAKRQLRCFEAQGNLIGWRNYTLEEHEQG